MAQNTTNQFSALLKLIRPNQWIKNGFVLVPLLFAHQYNNWTSVKSSLIAFVSFCLISSAIYIINDLCDINEDRNHPTKRLRPLASGAVSRPIALALMACLCALGSAVAGMNSYSFLAVALLYGLLNLAYSFFLKHIAILDVMTIGAGFVLRILGGSVAIAARPSHWILLCTIMISLFLGFTKRRTELVTCGQDSNNQTRPVLKDYSLRFLDQVIAIVTGATIICYALYTVDQRTSSAEVLGTKAMILTVPCVIYGMFRYLYIIFHLEKGEDPTDTLLHDRPSLLNLLIWLLLAWLIVSYGKQVDHYLIETLFNA